MASLADYIASLNEGRKAPLAGRSDPTQTSSSPLLSPRLTTPSARINNMMSSFTGAQAPRAPINNTVSAWHKAPWSENLRQDREELARLDEQRAEAGWGNLMGERTRGGAPEIVEIDDEAYNRMTPEQRAAVDYNTAYYRAVEADTARQASGLEPDEVQRGKYDKATAAIFGENAGESYAPDTVALLQSLGGVNKGANIDDYLNLGGAMTEVDILLIKQIELKYLTKIKRLFNQLAEEGAKAPNVSQLAEEINTSRATVMNYIKYLADARLINMIYPTGQEFPKKPSKVMMHNSNLMYAIYPIKIDKQEVMETFFVNSVWKDHKVSQTGKDHYFIVDGEKKFRICDAQSPNKVRNNPDIIYARYNTEVGKDNRIPLWLLGFLY